MTVGRISGIGGFVQGSAEPRTLLTKRSPSLYAAALRLTTGNLPPRSRSRAAAPVPNRQVTRNDVAALARVVPSTVSYVINNGPRSVSVEARERVLKAIATLGYHPSDVARSLRTRRTKTIGLVIPDITNPYYGEMAQAIEEFSFQRGYTVILG